MNAMKMMIFRMLPLGFGLGRESVANAAEREAGVANALGADTAVDATEDAEGWFKVSPYGVFEGRVPGRPQYFGQEQARRMVAEFNSLAGRLGRLFRGVPIFIGHPDVDPRIWSDDRRLGKVMALDVREDGLWARGEWNALGRENRQEGYWVYPSPHWDAPKGQARFEPDRLISIGLTNTPRIRESEPVANARGEAETIQGGEAADGDEEQTNENTTIMDPKLIREKLGLPPEATDDEVWAKLEALNAAADAAAQRASDAEAAKQAAEEEKATAEAEKQAMENSLREAEGREAQMREAANNALLDLAVRDGKITAAERSAWAQKLAGAEREAAVNSLAAMNAKLNTKGLGDRPGREEREQQDNLREAVVNAVSELEKTGLSYVDAWGRVKKDVKFSAYFQKEG